MASLTQGSPPPPPKKKKFFILTYFEYVCSKLLIISSRERLAAGEQAAAAADEAYTSQLSQLQQQLAGLYGIRYTCSAGANDVPSSQLSTGTKVHLV